MRDTDNHLVHGAGRDNILISPLFGELPLDFLVRGAPHPCPYLPQREAREEVFRTADLHPELYHDFMDIGFRRSGDYFYRPACSECRECQPIRVPSDEFVLTKSQRRVRNKNQDLAMTVCPPTLTEEKYRMYTKYQTLQHGAYTQTSRKELAATLYSSPVQTLEIEYRLDGRLVAVSIADLSSRSLSSVYVYYDPDLSSRSLGTFTALYEILYCRKRGIPYYYLGFYVSDCPSMNYKARFGPHETLGTDLSWNRTSAHARTAEPPR